MIHHITELPLPYKDGLSLFVFGDLQYGTKGFSVEAWEQFKAEFKSTPNAWALGLGDYEDWLRPSLRGRVIPAISSDDSARLQLDDRVRKGQDELLDRMAFLEGRLVGLHEGHHEWEFADRSKSTQRLCTALRCPFLGWMASTRLTFTIPSYQKPAPDKINAKRIWTMISMHGNSNARRTSGATLWLENNVAMNWVADHYIMGHSCKSANWLPGERRTIRRRGPAGVDMTQPRCLQVGGFHNGFSDGWDSSYVERSGFSPQPISWGVIRFHITRTIAAQTEKGLILTSVTKDTKCLDVEQVNRTLNIGRREDD